MKPESTQSLCHVVHPEGSGQVHFDRETVERLLADGNFFWLDLEKPVPEDFEILRNVFHFHPLAVEDSETFGQRAKIEPYDDFTFIVVYGAAPDEDRLVEVHCFYSDQFLVTVHKDDAPAFAEIRERYKKRAAPVDHPSRLLYRIVDGLVDSFFPILADFDDRIDALENAIFTRADDRQLQEIFGMKRLLVGMRKAITPQRDAFATLMGGVAELPGLSDDDERYFRDVYDHLIRISDLIDSYRDLLTGAMDVYLSTVSNRAGHGDEAARGHRDDFPAAHLDHRLLRSELRLPGPRHREPMGILGLRHRIRGRRRHRPVRAVPPPRLALARADDEERDRDVLARDRDQRERVEELVVPEDGRQRVGALEGVHDRADRVGDASRGEQGDRCGPRRLDELREGDDPDPAERDAEDDGDPLRRVSPDELREHGQSRRPIHTISSTVF